MPSITGIQNKFQYKCSPEKWTNEEKICTNTLPNNFAGILSCFYLRGTVHRIAAFILLLAILGQTFNQGFYYLGYLADNEAYARNCINKARPRMHCNGKCQFMKKILEQERKEQQSPELKLGGKSEVPSSKTWYTTYTPLHFVDIHHYFSRYSIGSPVDRPASFFHPPAA
jgi:hypothetical protein